MHDFWTESDDEDGRSKLKMFTIHNPDTWFYRQDIGDIARTMKREGFDLIIYPIGRLLCQMQLMVKS